MTLTFATSRSAAARPLESTFETRFVTTSLLHDQPRPILDRPIAAVGKSAHLGFFPRNWATTSAIPNSKCAFIDHETCRSNFQSPIPNPKSAIRNPPTPHPETILSHPRGEIEKVSARRHPRTKGWQTTCNDTIGRMRANNASSQKRKKFAEAISTPWRPSYQLP